MFGFGSKSIVGLDVGSSSIKAVELKRKGSQIERNVLRRFLLDRLCQFLVTHGGQRDLFHDDRVSTDRGGHGFGLDLVVQE